VSDLRDTGPQLDAQATPAEAESSDDALLARFDEWDSQLAGHWSAWLEKARYWYGFVGGDQWTEEEIAQLEGNRKIAVTFNLAGPVIDAVQGAEISNRQQVQYYPREVGDTGVADVLSQGAEYVSDECNGDQEDSESFWDCLICGLGWTETRPDVEGDKVMLIKERVDPLQMRADPSARKRCLEDMRYVKREIPMSPDDFEDFKAEMQRPDLSADGAAVGDGKRLTIVNPRVRYTHGMLGEGTDLDTVVVCEWQWWDREPVMLAAMPSQQDASVTQIQKLSPDDFSKVQAQMPDLKYVSSHHKVYYRAFTAGGELLGKEQLQENDFRYKCITGKRDRNAGTWFGLIKPMVDPQRFTNKLYSEILHIIRTNANGGMALEEDAVDDIRGFEQTWSATDKITWLKPGALSGAHGSKMSPKTPPPVQPALFQLMEFAKDMVQACTGVNEEILGLVGREQAGVLEQQRKQAAYGILSAFFDAKRRYQRNQGQLLLAQMRVYFPPDKLVRIVDAGTSQYVPLAQSLQTQEYDIIVDEAPSGPDQKAKVMQVMLPLLPQLLQAGLIGPEEIADILPFLDVPAAVSMKLANSIRQRSQMNIQMQQQNAQLEMQAKIAQGVSDLQNKQADTGVKQADKTHKEAQAFKAVSDAHASQIGLGVDFLKSTQPQGGGGGGGGGVGGDKVPLRGTQPPAAAPGQPGTPGAPTLPQPGVPPAVTQPGWRGQPQ
jgi:hypothetical protein